MLLLSLGSIRLQGPSFPYFWKPSALVSLPF